MAIFIEHCDGLLVIGTIKCVCILVEMCVVELPGVEDVFPCGHGDVEHDLFPCASQRWVEGIDCCCPCCRDAS